MPILARVWVIPVVTVLALGLLLTGAGLYVNSQYYVGTADGRVAVYHGVPQLSRVFARSAVEVNSLESQTKTAIDAHNISGSHAHVVAILEERMNVECAARTAERLSAQQTAELAASASPSPSTSSPVPSTPPAAAASTPAPSAAPSPDTSALPDACEIAQGGLR